MKLTIPTFWLLVLIIAQSKFTFFVKYGNNFNTMYRYYIRQKYLILERLIRIRKRQNIVGNRNLNLSLTE